MTPPSTDSTPASRPLRPADLMRGAYKGRGRDYLSLLVCPLDGAALCVTGESLTCCAHPAHVYPIESGIVRLAPPDVRAALDRLSAERETFYAAQGWPVPEEDEFKALPQSGLKGYAPGYWASQAAQTALLWRYVEALRRRAGELPVGPRGEAAVLGAGLGWLAYSLDAAGYSTLALDAHTGPRGGLGAYGFGRYVRVQADPAHPPIAAARFDGIVLQDVSDDAFDSALATARSALCPGGWLAVVDGATPGRALSVRARVLAADLAPLELPPRHRWRDRLRERWETRNGRGPELESVLVAQAPGAERTGS